MTHTSSRALPSLPLANLAFVMFAMAVSISFVFAVLPPVGREMGLSELQISLVVAPAALVFVIANGAWGLAVDRLGRKLVILIAVIAATGTSAAFAWIIHARLSHAVSITGAFLLLASCRLALGAFAGGCLPATQSFVAGITSPDVRTRALAFIGASFALGMVTGPGLAAATAGYGAVAPFIAVAILAALASLSAALLLAEPARRSACAPMAKGTTRATRLWRLLAIVVLTYTAYGALLQVTGFRMQDRFGLSAADAARWTGAALMAMAAGLVLTQILVARSTMSPGTSARAITVGCILALVAMATLAMTQSMSAQFLGLALFGVGLGAVRPSALSLLTIVAENVGDQGRVGGFSGAAQGLGLVFGPVTGAVGYQFDHRLPYLAGVAILIVATMLSTAAASAAPRVSGDQ